MMEDETGKDTGEGSAVGDGAMAGMTAVYDGEAGAVVAWLARGVKLEDVFKDVKGLVAVEVDGGGPRYAVKDGKVVDGDVYGDVDTAVGEAAVTAGGGV